MFEGRFLDLNQFVSNLAGYWSLGMLDRSAVIHPEKNAMFAFLVTCLLIELTPGPNMAYLAVLSASQGRRAGYIATLGVATGLLILGVCAVLGLTQLVSRSHALYETLRWGGFFYLLWLAWDTWRDEDLSSEAERAGLLQYWFRGLVTNLLNPKAGLFYVTVLPAFMDASRSHTTDAVSLCIVYVAVATTVHAIVVTLADRARSWLDNAQRRRVIRRIFAVLLVGIALWLLSTT